MPVRCYKNYVIYRSTKPGKVVDSISLLFQGIHLHPPVRQSFNHHVNFWKSLFFTIIISILVWSHIQNSYVTDIRSMWYILFQTSKFKGSTILVPYSRVIEFCTIENLIQICIMYSYTLNNRLDRYIGNHIVCATQREIIKVR